MTAFRRAEGSSEWLAGDPPDILSPWTSESLMGESNVHAIEAFWGTVPAHISRLVRPYPNRHWRLLSWAGSVGPAAEDLLRANPPLAYALAAARELAPHPKDSAAWATRPYQSQRRLLGRLGFPPTEQARRIVRKVEVLALTVPRLVDLRAGMARGHSVLMRLSHMARINAVVLGVVDGPIDLLTPRFLHRLSESASEAQGVKVAAVAADAHQTWQALRPRERSPLFETEAGLRAFRDGMVRELKTHRRRHAANLPAAPVSGTSTIVPLSTIQDLIEEGRAQHNCVASYASKARRGKVACYRVLEPERCTLALVPRSGGWEVSELKLAGNRVSSLATRRTVQQWLDEARRSSLNSRPESDLEFSKMRASKRAAPLDPSSS